MDILTIFLTSLLSVISLFIITKLMGHKQVAQLDFFDYISGITIGSIGAELATDIENFWKPLISLIIYGAVSVSLSLLTHKFPRTRKFVNGSPTILLNQGKLYRKNFKKAKLDLSEFMLLCREQGYFDIDDIQIAIFEHNGKLSIMPKASSRPATPNDLNIPAKAKHIGTEIIMDGCVLGENITRLGKDSTWLNYQLKLQGYASPKEIFLGIYKQDENSVFLYSLQ